MSDFRCKCCGNDISAEKDEFNDGIEIRIVGFAWGSAVTLTREDAAKFALEILDAVGETKGIKFPLF